VSCGVSCSNDNTFVTDDLVQCLCCILLANRCAFGASLAIGNCARCCSTVMSRLGCSSITMVFSTMRKLAISFSKDALLSLRRERKRTGTPLNLCLVGWSKVPTSRQTHNLVLICLHKIMRGRVWLDGR